MTNLFDRIREGEEDFVVVRDALRRDANFRCCVEINREGLWKCGSTNWMTEQQFKSHCEVCREKLKRMLKQRFI